LGEFFRVLVFLGFLIKLKGMNEYCKFKSIRTNKVNSFNKKNNNNSSKYNNAKSKKFNKNSTFIIKPRNTKTLKNSPKKVRFFAKINKSYVYSKSVFFKNPKLIKAVLGGKLIYFRGQKYLKNNNNYRLRTFLNKSSFNLSNSIESSYSPYWLNSKRKLTHTVFKQYKPTILNKFSFNTTSLIKNSSFIIKSGNFGLYNKIDGYSDLGIYKNKLVFNKKVYVSGDESLYNKALKKNKSEFSGLECTFYGNNSPLFFYIDKNFNLFGNEFNITQLSYSRYFNSVMSQGRSKYSNIYYNKHHLSVNKYGILFLKNLVSGSFYKNIPFFNNHLKFNKNILFYNKNYNNNLGNILGRLSFYWSFKCNKVTGKSIKYGSNINNRIIKLKINKLRSSSYYLKGMYGRRGFLSKKFQYINGSSNKRLSYFFDKNRPFFSKNSYKKLHKYSLRSFDNLGSNGDIVNNTQIDLYNRPLILKSNSVYKTRGLFFLNNKTNLVNIINTNTLVSFFKNPVYLYKLGNSNSILGTYSSCFNYLNRLGLGISNTNIIPSTKFKYSILKKVNNSSVNTKHGPLLTPWYYNNIVRFIEDVSGKKVFFQFYAFMAQEVSKDDIVRYKF